MGVLNANTIACPVWIHDDYWCFCFYYNHAKHAGVSGVFSNHAHCAINKIEGVRSSISFFDIYFM